MGRTGIRLGLTVSMLFAAAPVLAADGSKGPSEAIFIAELLALMIVGRLLGEFMLRLGQPAVMGQLLAGLILGPSLFGLLLPDLQHALFPKNADQKAMVDAISQFGVLLLLLLTGMETDLKLVRQTGRASIYASLMGIVVPFVCGLGLGFALPESLLPDPQKRMVTALFLGTALSIASVKIVAMVVREMNFLRRTVGQVLLASAIIDDSVGWIIVSIIFSIAQHGAVEWGSLAWSVSGTFVFMVASFTIGRRAVFFAIRWVNDTFISEFAVVTAILIIMGIMALITDAIGVHTVLGAFVAGILVGESPILTRHIDEQLRGIITGFFAPVFFGLAGLQADLSILANPNIAFLTAGLVLIASLGKFGGAFVGAELGGLTRREGLALACGMNARGSTEVIVATIGLSMGALNQDLFTMIVAMAVITTMSMPPTLRWALSRIPLRKQEKERLEREEMEAGGFVSNLERILVAVDDSPNGRFASRVAGMLAGTHGMPTTVLHIPDASKIEQKSKDDARTNRKAVARPTESKAQAKRTKAKEDRKTEAQPTAKDETDAERAGDTVKQAAERIKSEQSKEEKVNAPVDVTTIVHAAPSPATIAEEAEKGYDLMVIGMGQTSARSNEFDESVTLLARGFEGPLAVSVVRGDLLSEPDAKLSILVPVNGTEPSRNAAEVAITMARATRAQLTVLYVAVRDAKRSAQRTLTSRRQEEAILKDIVAIADGYNLSVRTAVLADRAPDEAILRELGRRKDNLVVLGVSRRPGDKLFFGDTAATLLDQSERSLLFVAS